MKAEREAAARELADGIEFAPPWQMIDRAFRARERKAMERLLVKMFGYRREGGFFEEGERLCHGSWKDVRFDELDLLLDSDEP